MKIILFGAGGKIGKAVSETLRAAGHTVIPVGRGSGDFRADIEDRTSLDALFRELGMVDAVAVAAGHVAFKPLAALAAEDFEVSLRSKFLGQVNVLQAAIPFLKDGGSVTLVSGVTARESIRDGVAAAAVSRAIEGFAMAAAGELPRGIRVNAVSPTVLEESYADYAEYFAGHEPVSGPTVGRAYLKAISGRMTGETLVP